MKRVIKKILAKFKNQSGFGLLELIVAMALFMIVVVAGSGGVLQTYSINTLSGTETQAKLYAQEGIEAVHSIAKQDFANIALGTYGLDPTSGSWVFSGSSETLGDYTRTIQVQEVQRDGTGNIVASGGTADPDIFRIVSTINWSLSPTRNNTVDLVSYVSNYRQTVPTPTDMAADIEADISNISWSGNGKRLMNLTLTNIGTSTAIVTEITSSWVVNTAVDMDRYRFDTSAVWSGSSLSGDTIDITDWNIDAGVSNDLELRFGSNVSDETQITVLLTFSDGSTKEIIIDFVGGNCGPQADDFNIDIASAGITGGSDEQLSGITIENTTASTCDVEVDTITASWGDSARQISDITLNATDFWTSGGVGSPTGTQTSGTELNGSNFPLLSTNTGPFAANFTFNGEMLDNLFTLIFKLGDGTTKQASIDLTVVPCPTMASIFSVNASAASLTNGNKRMNGVFLDNTSTIPTCAVTIDTITYTWTSSNRNIVLVQMGGTDFWNDAGPGTPTGSQSIGTELNGVDVTINPSDPVLEINRAEWSGKVSGDTFSIQFKFTDGSTYSVPGFNP
jgi:type II secretory pathway pseudopilin PulG